MQEAREEREEEVWVKEKEEVVEKVEEEVLQATHRGLGLLDLLDLPPGRRHRAGGLRGETGGVVKTLLGVKARLHHHPPPPLSVSRRCSTLGLFFPLKKKGTALSLSLSLCCRGCLALSVSASVKRSCVAVWGEEME